jgi:hypothetical protein
MGKIIGIFFITVLIVGGALVAWGVGVSNTEKKLRNKIEAQQESAEIFYTKLWEILKSKAGVTSEYAEQFKEIQFGIMEGRYSTGGEMMKWIQEANPEFDASLYKDLMNSIEGERNGFFVEQKKLLDMNKQHKDMLVTFPKKVILKNREVIEIVILKNTITKEAFETGTDQSPDLF